MNRREFIKLISVMLAGTVGCGGKRAQVEKLIPYLVPPEEGIIPGEPIYYSSSCTECPANCGILIKTIDGIPIKIEGNPEHPVNEGKLCVRGQSSIMRLYHPKRLKSPLLKRNNSFVNISWEDAYKKIEDELIASKKKGLNSIYISGRTTGISSELIKKFCQMYEIEKIDDIENFSYSSLRQAYNLLFNINDLPQYKISECDLLITIGADIFETFISPVNYAVQFSKAKRENNMKWFHVEPHLSLTGAKADKRIIVKPCSEFYLLLYILKNINFNQKEKILGKFLSISDREIFANLNISSEELKGLVESFLNAKNPLLIAGGVSVYQNFGLETALLSALIQWYSGMVGKTIDFNQTENYASVGSALTIKEISKKMDEDKVGFSIVSKINLIKDFGSIFNFQSNFKKIKFKVYLTDFLDETAKECDLVLPLSHSLEAWGDVEPRKYLKGLVQPAIKPLFDTKSEAEFLLSFIQKESFQKFLFRTWSENYGKDFLEFFFKKGYYEEKITRKEIILNEGKIEEILNKISLPKPIEFPVLIINPSIRFYDGRSKTIPLLEEIPDSLTTISYGEWISVSEEDALRYNLKNKDEISLDLLSGERLRFPVKILPLMPPNIYAINYGSIAGNHFKIDEKTGEKLHFLEIEKIVKTNNIIDLPILSGLLSEEGRKQEEYSRRLMPEENHSGGTKIEKHSFYPEPHYKEYRWAMAIDLALCIGCSACVAACYIENNIPLVGKEEHLNGREMSWIRIEPYYFRNEGCKFIPMLCQQCDYAPCEPVCPVYATYHNPEGLNAQIYNRCVGTRYCSNNCPYKARRFNWFEHKKEYPLNKLINPEVFVRGKGVMEKCTFCIQRIRRAHDRAKDEGRKIKDGEVIPACAQTCPTGAITFGNLLDKTSKIYQLANSKRAYRIFEELGTSPAVYYLH